MEAILKKGNKNYILVTSRWENFIKFCERVKEELGETLFEVLDPVNEEGKIYVHIPSNNKNRLREAVCNFSGTEIHPAYFHYYGNETTLTH